MQLLTRSTRRAATLGLLVFSSLATAAESTTPAARIADLAWLAGHWQGQLANGATFEAHYTDAGGGTILSVSKEHRDGRTLSYELELFHEKEGRLLYLPHPNGKRSEHAFPLIAYDAIAKRAVFENKAHDYPQAFVFHLESPDRLVITLSGPGRNGQTKEIRYALSRLQAANARTAQTP
jgi:hypothetical protein